MPQPKIREAKNILDPRLVKMAGGDGKPLVEGNQ